MAYCQILFSTCILRTKVRNKTVAKNMFKGRCWVGWDEMWNNGNDGGCSVQYRTPAWYSHVRQATTRWQRATRNRNKVQSDNVKILLLVFGKNATTPDSKNQTEYIYHIGTLGSCFFFNWDYGFSTNPNFCHRPKHFLSYQGNVGGKI